MRPSFEVFVKPRAILTSALFAMTVAVSPLAHAAGELPQPALSASVAASSSMPTTLPVPGSATSSRPAGPKLSDEIEVSLSPPVCGFFK